MRRFRHLVFAPLAFCFLFASYRNLCAQGQPPQLLHFQARLANTGGTPLEGPTTLEIRIYDVPTGGSPLWFESQTPTALNGVVNLLLGENVAIPTTLFDGSTRYVAFKVGSDPEMSPRRQIVSVAYALRAGKAASLDANATLPNDIITSAHILDGTIGAVDLADGSVVASKLATASVTASTIAAGAVGSAALAPGAVTALALAAGSVGNSAIAPNAVDGTKIASLSVDNTRIADGAVSSTKLAPGAVTAGALGAGAVTSIALAPGSVTASAVAPGSIGSAALASSAVLSATIAPDSVDGSKILDGTVGAADLADGSIVASKLGLGSVTSFALASGSVGPAALGVGAVLNFAIAPGAVNLSSIAPNSVDSSRIVDGSIVGVDLADGAVVAAKLGVGAVTPNSIAPGAVGNAALAPSSVDGTKIAPGSIGPVNFASPLTGPGNPTAVVNVLATDPNSTAITGNGFLNGVQGISTSTFGSAIGVMGQSSSFAGVGVYGISPLYGERGIASSSTGTNYGVHGTTFSSTGYAVYANGNFGGTGFKYFVQPHPTDPSKEVRFVCLEGNESGTYFRGSAKIEKGIATIEVPEDFRLVTEASGMTVQVTPVGARAELWIDSKDLDKVVIRGTADVKFDYFVNGVRRGFADHKSIQENHSFVPAVRGVPFGTQFPEALRKILVANQILNPDLTPNEATAARLGWQLQDPTPATSGGK